LILWHPDVELQTNLVQFVGVPQFVSLYWQTPCPLATMHFPVRHFEVELHTTAVNWQVGTPFTFWQRFCWQGLVD